MTINKELEKMLKEYQNINDAKQLSLEHSLKQLTAIVTRLMTSFREDKIKKQTNMSKITEEVAQLKIYNSM